MKKSFFIAVVFAIVLVFSSCSQAVRDANSAEKCSEVVVNNYPKSVIYIAPRHMNMYSFIVIDTINNTVTIVECGSMSSTKITSVKKIFRVQ